jgi:hypothetical protein
VDADGNLVLGAIEAIVEVRSDTAIPRPSLQPSKTGPWPANRPLDPPAKTGPWPAEAPVVAPAKTGPWPADASPLAAPAKTGPWPADASPLVAPAKTGPWPAGRPLPISTESPAVGGLRWDNQDTEFLANALRQLVAALSERAQRIRGTSGEERAELLENLEPLLEQVSGANDAYFRRPDYDVALRKTVLDAYFDAARLLGDEEGRLLEVQETEEVATQQKRPSTQKKRPSVATTRVAPRKTRSSAWKPLLLVAVLLIGAWRVWALFTPPSGSHLAPTKVVNQGDVKGADSEGKSKAVTEALKKGVPVVTSVRLYQDGAGNLKASATAMDTNSASPKLSYQWLEDGKTLSAHQESTLPAAKVVSGASYQVIVTATDGQHTSAPLEAGPLLVTKKER